MRDQRRHHQGQRIAPFRLSDQTIENDIGPRLRHRQRRTPLETGHPLECGSEQAAAQVSRGHRRQRHGRRRIEQLAHPRPAIGRLEREERLQPVLGTNRGPLKQNQAERMQARIVRAAGEFREQPGQRVVRGPRVIEHDQRGPVPFPLSGKAILRELPQIVADEATGLPGIALLDCQPPDELECEAGLACASVARDEADRDRFLAVHPLPERIHLGLPADEIDRAVLGLDDPQVAAAGLGLVRDAGAHEGQAKQPPLDPLKGHREPLDVLEEGLVCGAGIGMTAPQLGLHGRDRDKDFGLLAGHFELATGDVVELRLRLFQQVLNRTELGSEPLPKLSGVRQIGRHGGNARTEGREFTFHLPAQSVESGKHLVERVGGEDAKNLWSAFDVLAEKKAVGVGEGDATVGAQVVHCNPLGGQTCGEGRGIGLRSFVNPPTVADQILEIGMFRACGDVEPGPLQQPVGKCRAQDHAEVGFLETLAHLVLAQIEAVVKAFEVPATDGGTESVQPLTVRLVSARKQVLRQDTGPTPLLSPSG
ncbi:MAG: hypothetical protein BWX48_01832 [Verrucomicrobia bacterium ADurb.Bin006]|nr:MAG: hypothetical protein BWX48_01832 [Verrucomicrobia bacterium ADurb.Bin006]